MSATVTGMLDDLVGCFFGALTAPVHLAVTTLHGRPSLSSLDEGGGGGSPSPDAGPSHGH